MEQGEDDMVTAIITSTTVENGEKTVDVQTITGTMEEVKAKVESLKEVDGAGKVIQKIEVEEVQQ